MNYLERATSFVGFEKKAKSSAYECPLCKTYGGWNLLVDAYGKGKHFNASCFQCNGWGWVTELDKDCIHDFKELGGKECRERNIVHWGMCWHVQECIKCKRIISYDTSD